MLTVRPAAVAVQFVGHDNEGVRSESASPAHSRPGDIWRSVRLPMAAGVVALTISSCGGNGTEFPAPPRNAPIVLPVVVSRNGRVITVRAAKPCGHRPLLLARSFPDRVTLRLVNRGVSNCHVEAVGVISVTATLARPLGNRPLVQALNGKPIRYRLRLPSVTYPWLGVNISASPPASPGPLAADAASPAAVLTAFKSQGDASLVGSELGTERPLIILRTITELHPTSPQVRPHVPYTGWVVIYHHVRLVSYGPRSLAKNTRGTFVAILDAATGQWTNFFSF